MTLLHDLSADHYSELMVGSCIRPDVAAARGYRTLTGTGSERDGLVELGFSPSQVERDEAYPLLLIPMKGADGEPRGYQIKPAVPRHRLNAEGHPKPIKYETPAGAPLVLDVPEYTRQNLGESRRSLWITEGMKKVDSLVSHGQLALGLTGVYNWRTKMGTLGDWEDIPLKDRTVVVCFDSDAAGNRNVQQAMGRLGAWLKSKGARVKYLVVPAQVGDEPVKGVDDFFAAGGTLEALAVAATETAPGAGSKDAGFTDALLVERAVEETLAGRFRWAQGLGWLGWNGRVWREVSDVDPLEAIRQWAAGQFEAACAAMAKNPSDASHSGKVAGWRGVLAKAKLIGLRDLARGIEGVQCSVNDFDGNRDLVTCLSGTIHLPTGTLQPFDPADLITKSLDAEYRQGLTHPLWTKALSALPADLHAWYQDRMGQALTGYSVPDHKMVIGHGSGSNGKSTVVSIFRRTFGDYGVMISDRVLMASPDAHPTELMDLRGARYAVLEETPEARHLNVQRLKTVVGTESIKARRIRQDPVEFLVSHSLFINTNYVPTVTETDHGTWRRLALLTFPYTYRAPREPLTGPLDRPGDPDLAYAADNPAVRAAALSWMVEGAKAWYARERRMLPVPDRIKDDTRGWRSQTDLILGFADDALEFGPEHFTQTTAMLNAFNEWAGERGHKAWNDRTFASRFLAHEMVQGHKVGQVRQRVNGKVQRGWSCVKIKDDNGPWGNEPEPEEPPREYGGCICGSTSTDPAEHAEYCGFDAEEQRRARNPKGPTPEEDAAFRELIQVTQELGLYESPEVVRSEPQEPNTNEILSAVGFDLETADAGQLFTGGHKGPFVRLMGVKYPEGHEIDDSIEPVECYPPKPFRSSIGTLEGAETIYGHNILGFDLLALAHHHGADYDRLAEKSIDTLVIARLVDPPVSKGLPNGYYSLDSVAERLGGTGKTDDLKALAGEHGGYDKIPTDDRRYHDYLRGDLAASKFVYEAMVRAEGGALPEEYEDYAKREMRIVAMQNRMTLNGWRVDRELLAQRVAYEKGQRDAAIEILRDTYGVPTHRPDRFKTVGAWRTASGGKSYRVVNRYVKLFPEAAVRRGLAERIPGEAYDAPWATDAGRAAIIRAFAEAGAVTKSGAPAYPTTAKGVLALGKDAMGEGTWYCKDRQRVIPGMLNAFGHVPAVRALVEVILQATGARMKYAEIAKYVTKEGRVHAWIGEAQGSGRWAMTQPSITNMGIRGQAAEERAVLVSDPGETLITVDASQVDMRAMAGLSQDAEYMKLFAPGRDAHTEMAIVYFNDGGKDARQRTKAINHKFNYGGGVKSTAAMNGIDEAVVQRAYDARAEAYPRLLEYTAEVRAQAEAGQFLDNGFGRKLRANPDRAWTQAPALVGQGAARDIICESILRLIDMADARGLNARPHLRGVVHDELVMSVPDDQVETWQELMTEAFTWEWKDVPILCELGTPAKNWADCK